MNNHKFNHIWYLKDKYPSQGIKKHNLKVFGTFICGGGSSMGYKLAGFEHLGGVEIDPLIADFYKTNHNPKYLFVEDIRKFVKRNEFPEDLMNLDILEGSPPCSSFSMSGNREKDWGKEKVFREGQAMQKLDDLFFDYILLAEKLQPKVVIAENVKGLLQGNAKNYVHKIKAGFENAGYKVQLFLLNAASMGVPQRRERVFFICQREDLNLPKLKLNFDEIPINYGEIRINGLKDKNFTEYDINLWNHRLKSDRNYSDILERIENRCSNWNVIIVHDNEVCGTIVSSSRQVSFTEPKQLCDDELKMIGTYPLDYDFKNMKPKYLIGMSVPPVMMAQISHQIYLQWFKNIA